MMQVKLADLLLVCAFFNTEEHIDDFYNFFAQVSIFQLLLAVSVAQEIAHRSR